MAQAVVLSADIAAGHDGAADLLLTVRYENGVVGTVLLDADSGFEIMQSSGADSLTDLVGRNWRDLLKEI